MRLIDAEILRDRLYKTRNAALADGRNKAYGKGIRDAIEIVEQQPTVEPDIVRCKDCKHQDPDRFNDGSNRYVCRNGHGWKPDDWYCADGERRTDDA